MVRSVARFRWILRLQTRESPKHPVGYTPIGDMRRLSPMQMPMRIAKATTVPPKRSSLLGGFLFDILADIC